MRNSALVSLLVICFGCGPRLYVNPERTPNTTGSCIEKLKPVFSSALYSAQVNVTGKHLSGLLLFKSMADSSKRVVFTNEMGVTFFDFEFTENGFRVVNILEKMNKKLVINRLRDDLALIMMHGYHTTPAEIYNLGTETWHRFSTHNEQVNIISDTGCTALIRIETASARKKKIIVNFSGYGSGMPDSVYLAHQSFEYNITLKQLHR